MGPQHMKEMCWCAQVSIYAQLGDYMRHIGFIGSKAARWNAAG